jgi:hypothetical protein
VAAFLHPATGLSFSVSVPVLLPSFLATAGDFLGLSAELGL